MTTKTDYLRIKFETDGDGNVKASLNGLSQDIAKVDRAASTTSMSLGKMTGAIQGFVGAAAVGYIVQTTVEFQRLNAALVTVTGSQANATREFSKLKDFAARTPFQLTEVVDAFIKLKARGLDPSEAAMKSYGNTAAAMGKSLDQVIEAVGDAATGQMERLREFGILSKQEGDRVTFTFQGVATEVGRNAAEIEGYLQSLGNVQFAGGMDRQADTLGGALSNARDAADGLASSIGNVLSPALISLIKDMSATTTEAALLTRAFDRMLDGITPEVGAKTEQVFRSIGAAIDFVNSPMQEFTRLMREGVAETQREFESKGKFTDKLVGALAELNVQAAKTAAAQTSISDSTQKLVDGLTKEAEVYGLSKSASLEYAKAQALATAANDTERTAITAAYDALIKKAKAEEAGAAATKTTAANARAAAIALKEWNAQAATFTGVQQANAKALEETTRQQEAYDTSLQQMIESVDDAPRALREMEAAVRLLEVALADGQLSPERYAELVSSVMDQFEAGLGAEEVKRAAEVQVDGYTEVWLRGVESLSDTLADSLVDGFKDGGEALKDTLKNILKDMLRMILQQKLVIPLQTQILQGAGFSGGQIQQMLGGFMPQNGGVGGPGTTTAGNPFGGAASTGGGAGGLFGGAGGIFSTLLGGAGIGGAIGGALGGGGSAVGGAVLGAVGSLFGPIGTLVGSIVGSLIGGLLRSDDPILEVSATAGGINHGRVEGQATSALGNIFVGKDDLTLPDNLSSQALAQQIAEFDNAIAQLLDATDLEAARAALARFNVDQRDGAIDPEKILEQRLRMVINAVEPEFARFLNGISDIEERVRKFEALRSLREYIEDFDATIDELNPDGVQRLRAQLQNLDEAVETTAAQLAEAIASKDLEGIAAAADAAKQAVIRKFQAEIEAAQQLQAAIGNAERSMRAFSVSMAQRLLGVGGDRAGVVNATAANIGALRGAVLNASDVETALQHLDEFVSTVDQWLQASRAAVQAWHAEQQALLQAQMAALDAEQQGIYSTAQIRAEAEAAFNQQVQEAQNAQLQAQREALQEQLRIAQQWLGVLARAEDLIHQLTTGSANPLAGESRLALLNAEIAALQGRMGSASGEEQAGIATQLTQLLQERLALAGELYQRPSNEYLTTYNNTLRELAEIRDAARGPAELAAQLQAELNALQQGTTDAVSGGFESVLQFNTEEQARLVEIEAERARLAAEMRALDVEAAARQAAIDDEARAFYLWAQSEGERLQAERHAELTAQLELLTGGLSIDEFIAQQQERATTALETIRDDLQAFLALLAGNVAGGGGGIITPPGPRDPLDPGLPGPGNRPAAAAGGSGNVYTVDQPIQLMLDGRVLTNTVVRIVIDNTQLVAPALKRELRVA